ncbi:MAG: DUF4382 domain-containing protein [Gemmatimonas sp.]|nr:DUF4382 domain-containing protein [Gemmatimonadaceae bacterium]
MKRLRFIALSSLALAAATIPVACSDSGLAGVNGTMGSVIVRLTDAPFLTDSVKSVDIFVVRVDGRTAAVDDAAADQNADNGSADGWHTLASPGASYNLLELQNGASTTLGSAPLTAGTYNGFRFIIDPTKSSVTLKNGKVLTGTSSPNITFPSASRSGIKINLTSPVNIVGGATTTLLVDFDVNGSFVQRGNSIEQNGLLFKPVIRGTVIDAATVNANIRLANATDAGLDLVQGTTVLSGSSNVLFGTNSSCSSVNAATPGLSVRLNGTTTALPGFTPTLTAGNSYSIVAYPNGAAVQFATLLNTFTPTAGQSGLRVFNATGGATGYDVFVTASGAPLGTPTIVNAVSGVASTFVSVPAGSSEIRVTATGLTAVLLDLTSQTLTADKNATLVIAPPAAGSTTLRAFLVPAC